MHSTAAGALRRAPDEFVPPFLMDAPATESEPHGIVLIDCRGVVRFCNRDGRRLLGGAGSDLLGSPIAALLPELRLKPETPGHNLAHMLFRFPNEGWYPVRAESGEGRFLNLELSVSVLRVDNKHLLLLGLRPRAD